MANDDHVRADQVRCNIRVGNGTVLQLPTRGDALPVQSGANEARPQQRVRFHFIRLRMSR